MDFAPDDLLGAIQATAQRVAQGQRNAAETDRERVGRDAAVQAGLLELLLSDDPDEAPGALAFALALHTLAQADTGLALWVWAQNIAQTAANTSNQARAWRDGTSVAVPLDLELHPTDGWHVSSTATQTLALRDNTWRLLSSTAGVRTTVGADGADIGRVTPTTELAPLQSPNLPLAISGLAAIAAGVAHRATRASVDYALVRQQFGHPIAEFQAIQFMVADSQTAAEAARLMALSSASQSDLATAARALSAAATAARTAADTAVQVHGGAGYTRDYPAESLLRDASLLKQIATHRFTTTALPPFANPTA